MSYVFPVVLHFEGGPSVTLFADGTLRGSPQTLELWMTKLDTSATLPHPETVAAVQFWLMLRALQDDLRIGRTPRPQGDRRQAFASSQ